MAMNGVPGRALLVIFVSFSLPLQAQLLKDIQKAVVNEAKSLTPKKIETRSFQRG